MYWTLESNTPPRCLYRARDESVDRVSVCGDRWGEHADPDSDTWKLTALCAIYEDLQDALHDDSLCIDCRDEVAATHNYPAHMLP